MVRFIKRSLPRRYKRGYRIKRKRRAPKSKTYYQKRTGMAAARVKAGTTKLTLKKRVKILEGNTKKHHDLASAPGFNEFLNWNGTTYPLIPALSPRNCFRQILMIQGRAQNGDMPLQAGSIAAQDSNCRESNSIFVTKVRIRGILRGVIPRPRSEACAQLGTETVIMCPDPVNIQAGCKTKMWLVILQDKRPSIVSPDGTSAENPPEAAGTSESPIESLSGIRLGAATQILEEQGFGASLQSYESTRYKVIFAKAYETSYISPDAEFDVNLTLNKTLKYTEPRAGQPASNNVGAPLNYNLYCYLLCHRTYPIQDPAIYKAYFQKPTLVSWTSRTYYRDS